MERQGHGWVVYSGISLIIIGVLDVFNALWAFDSHSRVDEMNDAQNLIVFDSDLRAWGWFYLVVGILLIAAGFGVFGYRRWARVIGIIAGTFGLVVNFFWIPAFPFQALVLVVASGMVVFGLSNYGGEETRNRPTPLTTP